jgi:hypothetical protein
MRHPNRRLAAGLVLALLAFPALTACSVIETTIEQLTGGEVEIGGNSVPADFPAEIPLAPGEVLNGSSATKDDVKVWNVAIKVADGVGFDAIAAELEAAGFAPSPDVGSETADGRAGLYANENYSVLLSMTTQEVIGTIANYTVTATP